MTWNGNIVGEREKKRERKKKRGKERKREKKIFFPFGHFFADDRNRLVQTRERETDGQNKSVKCYTNS